MRPEQWSTFKRVARGGTADHVPVALIVDSPWIPGYAGVNHLDYYLDPEIWYRANLRVAQDFPEVIPVPSWWLEYGMAIEPSALGARLHFQPDQPPGQSPTLARLEDVQHFSPVNPYTDGLMSWALRRYQTQKDRIFEAGFTLPMATARGPLCLASFLRGVTQFMMDLVEDAAGSHRLLEFATDTVIAWLQAQAEVIGPTVESIFVLDDIPGMLSRRLYLEFAHPYLKRICEAFPPEWVKVYHNDANVRPFLADLAGTGFDVLNWSHNLDVRDARAALGEKMCLMGNVAPLDLGVRGAPDQVKAAAREVLRKSGGKGLILSVGGGVSPGMPAANIRALVQAARSFGAERP
ncbi:MAG: uroporphyrinogen decarboxylase family protein [Bryobacterales bacterium]|nr:uroporphyrinogen decarboxylase family protein [Bryobacterales bacterium]